MLLLINLQIKYFTYFIVWWIDVPRKFRHEGGYSWYKAQPWLPWHGMDHKNCYVYSLYCVWMCSGIGGYGKFCTELIKTLFLQNVTNMSYVDLNHKFYIIFANSSASFENLTIIIVYFILQYSQDHYLENQITHTRICKSYKSLLTMFY